jgi:hypothetical protein
MSNLKKNAEQDTLIGEVWNKAKFSPSEAKASDFTVLSHKQATQLSKPAHNQHPSHAQIEAERHHGRPVETQHERPSVESGANQKHRLSPPGTPMAKHSPPQSVSRFRAPIDRGKSR